MNCPNCGKRVQLKGHYGGQKAFRELTDPQKRAAIAKATRDLTAMKRAYQRDKATK